MSVGDIKFFTISQNGFVLSVQAVDMGSGQTQFFIKSNQGQGDLNAIWWSDGDSTVDGSITLSKSDSSLNMNGTGIVWDGYDYLSSAGLGKLGEAKSTFITQGETLTYIANVSLADVSTLGIRATSVNGGDSIKGVDTSADQAFKLPTVSIGDASVTEGGKAQFTVSLSNAYAYDIKVYYGTGDGTATAGSDYTGTSGYVIIPAGQTTATVYVQTLDDYYKEANETFNVTLSSATTDVLGSNINLSFTDNSGVGTIIDDKDTTTITLSAPAAVDEGGSITVTANVDHPPQGDLTITLSNGQTITILSGQTSGQVTFAAPADDVYNDASTLNLSINSTTGGNYEQLVTTATASVAVHDTIDTTAITLDDVSVNEGAGTATITAHVANAVTGSDLVINLDNGASVTIAVGATSGVSTAFAVQGDDPYVDGESYQVGVSGTSGGNFEALDTSDKATVTVHDTIDTTAITLDDVSVNEGAGTATITAHVANAVTGSDLVINLDNGASVTIAVGATSGVSTAFAVQGDDPYVDGESYQVGVSGTSGGNFEALDTSDKATVTVHDTIDTTAITLDDVSVNEGAGTATITAHVANAVTGSDLVINLDNGTSVTIAVGATSGVSTAFAVQGDDPYVDGESYQVGVSGTSGGNFEALDTSDKATVTVHDTIDTTAITLDDVSVNEGAGTATITAHVANAVTGSDLVINLDNGASVTMAVGATSGVSTAFAVQGDDPYVDGESYQVGVSGTSGGNFEALDTSDKATVTVHDTIDTTAIALDDVSVNEGAGTATITAHVANAVTGSDLVINLDNGASVTIAVGATSGVSTAFAVQGDDPYVDGESYQVGVSGTSGGNFEALDTSDKATVTVHDTIDTTAITLDDVSVNEGAGTATITAHVANAVTGTPLVINLDNGASVTIAVGATSGVSTAFAVQGDDPYVDGESYQVGVSGTSGGNFEALDTSDKATVTVHDTIDTTAITLDDVSVNEGAGTATITAHVANAVTGSDLVINLDNGTSVTIAVGATSGVSTAFAVQGDDPYVDGESYQVGVSGTSGGNFEALDTSDKATVTVHDTIDTTAITLDDVSVNEGAGTATITAHVANAVTGSDLVINLDNGASVTMAVGATSGVSTAFAVQGDDPYVDGESYQVGVSGTSGGNFEALDTSDKATVTVHDTIDTTAITLDDVSVNEGAGTATITAHVANAVTGSDLVINLDNGASVTIAVGATSGVSTAFAVQGDDPYVDGESYQVGVSGTSGGNFEALDTSDKATVTVHDTIDTTAIALDDVSVNEGAGTATITAHVANAVTGSDLVINLDNGASVTIAVGATSGVSTAFAVQGDDPYVDGESYQVGVSGTSGGNFEALDTSDKATVTVHDTIDTTAITLDDVSVNEGAGTATITAHVANAVTGSDLVINLDNGASVTIAVGATSGVSTAFAVQGDDPYVDGESYQVGVSGTSGGNFEALDTSDKATVTVHDTIDTTAIALDDVSVNEGAGTATITAHVANAVTGSDLVINLDNGASVTIAVGATSGVSTAFAVADNNVYGDSTNYQVGITGTSGGNFEALNTSDTAKVTVNDNDSPPSFSINDVTVSETAGTITFTVTKTGATALPATVNYQVAPGTASAGSDYSAGPDPLSGMLSFAAGETSKTVTLTIVDNAVFEPTEQFTVNLSSPTNATISDTQGVGTITDNDLSDLGGPTGIDFVPTQTGNNALLGHFIELGDPDATDSFTFSYSATSNNALPASNVSVDSTGSLTASQSNTSIGDYTLHVTVTDQANNSTSADFHLLVGQNGSSADPLNGGTGSDIAAGFNGGDTLTGGAGRDYLLGGQQDDILSGGGGNDVLLGGGGNDQFRMIAPSLNGTDTILDFAIAGHTIGLQQGASSWNAANTTATAAGAGLSASDYQTRNAITNIAVGDTNKVVEIQTAQNNAQIVNGTAGAANAYVAVFNSDTGKGELWYDNNWSDTTGRVHVATLDDVTSVTQLLGLDNSKFIEWT